MRKRLIILLFLWVFVWFMQSCKRDAPIVPNNTGDTNTVSVNVTENQLIGNWKRCIGCTVGGPFRNKKIEFSDSGKVKIFENYNGGQDTFGLLPPFAYGTYQIIGGDTLSMALVYDTTYTLCANDTIITYYKILDYRLSQPYNIPFIMFEFYLTINSCNEPLSAGFCPVTNPPRQYYEMKNNCY